MCDHNFSSIIPTAILTAYPRTLTDIPYSKDIYNILKERITITDNLTNDLLAPELEARYKLTDKLLKQSKIKQVIEIAAGYSQRGIIESQNGLIYVEFDLDRVCKLKKDIIKLMTTPQNNLHVVSGNALNLLDLQKCEQYLNSNEELAIINEGLFRYLSFEEKEKVAKNIYQLLKKYGGVWITCDVTPKRFLVNQNSINPTLNKTINNVTTRNDINDRFEDKEHITNFFDDIGFNVEFHDFKEVKGLLSSPTILKLDDQQVERILDGAIVAVMKIKGEGKKNDR